MHAMASVISVGRARSRVLITVVNGAGLASKSCDPGAKFTDWNGLLVESLLERWRRHRFQAGTEFALV